MTKHTHSGKLERFLGKEVVETLSDKMKDWYGPPIALAGVPGNVFVNKGGDFTGRIAIGGASTAMCFAEDFLKRVPKRFPAAFKRWQKNQESQLNTGFSSLGDLISEATTGGKRRDYSFQKVGTTGVVAVTNTLWYVGNLPAAGGAGGAAPGGTAWDKTSTGALYNFDNPTGGDTQHFVTSNIAASVAGNTLLMYDRIFSVLKTMNSTATEAVTGVPTRYQSTTNTAEDYAAGNFLMIETRGALAATAHNWTVCQYTDQDGNATITLPTVTGNSAAIANRLDQPTSQWFCPLATGDTGIKALTQMQCSAAVASGNIDFTIGHPLVWIPIPIINMACVTDGISTAFNLVRIFDDACLALLEVTKPATGATTYTGTITTVRG